MKTMPRWEYELRTLVSHLFSGLAGVLFTWSSIAQSTSLLFMGVIAAITGKYLADKLAVDLIGTDEL